MLNPDYKDMLLCLKERNVKFLVVGAYAIAAHGYPRFTNDIDLWIKPAADNAKAAFHAIRDFGAPIIDLNEESLQYPGVVYQIGVAPLRIDLLTEISGGIDFDEAYESSLVIELDSVELRIPSVEILIRNKMSTGRDKDNIDVKALRKRL